MATKRRPRSLPFPFGAFREFVRLEASGGIILLACAVAALIWANVFPDLYTRVWETHLRIGYGDGALDETLRHWINDGLMAVFFFVVGLEIKRELLAGELASPRQAALPMVAALGGMVVPAGLYAALNAGGDASQGWGVPMATDIAFALGVLMLLGDRVPSALKVFLTAIAIVDDLGAILVIAVFYSAQVTWLWLAAAAVGLGGMVALNAFDVRHPLPYALIGTGLWFAFLQSGVHATVAGVIAAATIPARSRIDGLEFLVRGRYLIQRFEQVTEEPSLALTTPEQQDLLFEFEEAIDEVMTPLQRLENALHPWVIYFILPVFALANAGVEIQADVVASLVEPLGIGIVLGLVVGKQVGVTLFSWLAVRFGVASLPEGVGWRQVYGVAWLAGIGFTMSLFIAGLAFGEGSEQLDGAKLAILVASATAGLGGWFVLTRSAESRNGSGVRPGPAGE